MLHGRTVQSVSEQVLFFYANRTKAKMLSEGGRCKTFDATADGYSRGEGGVGKETPMREVTPNLPL